MPPPMPMEKVTTLAVVTVYVVSVDVMSSMVMIDISASGGVVRVFLRVESGDMLEKAFSEGTGQEEDDGVKGYAMLCHCEMRTTGWFHRSGARTNMNCSLKSKADTSYR